MSILRGTRLLATGLCLVALFGLTDCSCRGDSDSGDGGADGGGDGGATCTDGVTQSCGTNVGECSSGNQTCTGGVFGACQGEVAAGTETCDGLDNDCDGDVDEDCPCNDTDTQACGSSEGECTAGTQTCSGGAWGACVGEIEGGAETCNGLDDDCDGSTDEGVPIVPEQCNGVDDDCDGSTDEGQDPIPAANVDGECAGNAQVCNGAAGYEDDPTNYVAVAESCNDLDDDCLNGVDDGCDDDLDGYCDSGFVVVGTPAICPNSLAGTADDCDDTRSAVNPGEVELCSDGLDNNCDGDADFADTVNCPFITVTINAFSSPTRISHGGTRNIFADIDPDDGPPVVWPRVWSITDAQPAANCLVGDVNLANQTDTFSGSQIEITVPDLPAQEGCIYTLNITVNGYAQDNTDVQMVNGLPNISVTGAIWDGTVWRLRFAAGSTPSITASAWDPDNDRPIDFDWAGADVGELACAPNCQSTDGVGVMDTTVDWAAPAGAGSYSLTVTASDRFAVLPASADVVVDIDPCLWVEAGASGSGGLPGDPMGSVQAALDQAALVAGTVVCVIGDWNDPVNPATWNQNLNIPSSPNSPDLIGGYDSSGARTNDRPAIYLSRAAGIAFATGNTSTVQGFLFQQSTGYTPGASEETAVVTIEDASPTLIGNQIYLDKGSPTVGIDINDTTDPASTNPQIVRNDFRVGPDLTPDVTAIQIDENAGASVNPTIRGSNINIWSCLGKCRGVHFKPGTGGTVTDGNSIFVTSTDDTSYGIDVEGAVGRPTSAVITNNANISATGGDVAVGVRLWMANRVTISGNVGVGGLFGRAARQFGAGIADGEIDRDGVHTPGNSSLITIANNDTIGAGASWWAADCTNPGDTGEGADIAVGIFLAGTTDVTIENNGRTGGSFGGVFGGGTTVHWDPSVRRLPPSVPGLWLLNTNNVAVLDNEIKAGSLSQMTGCPVNSPTPAVIAYRDGIPPNPVMGLPGSTPSLNTVIDRNGLSCALPPENGAIGFGIFTWCVTVELNAPAPAIAGNAPLLINNVLAATKGNVLVGLRQRGGSGVRVINNTIDSDLMLKPWEPPPPPNVIFKWPVLLEEIVPGGIELFNNIIYAHYDPPYDNAAERLCIREVVASGTSSSVASLENSLFYIEGDNLTAPSAPYIRVLDAVGQVEYASDQLNSVTGVATNVANFAALPGLIEYANDWQKSQMRLMSGSAAIDAGKSVAEGAPGHDMDNDVTVQGRC